MPYDASCSACPYNNQDHLIGTPHFDSNLSPVELENNDSDVLIVLLAPGIEEWQAGRPIMPTVKPGGTGGVRIKNSWGRKTVERADFDIVNAVQCFTGNNGNGDLPPSPMAICCCNKRLLEVLRAKNYVKIIALGDVAYLSVCCLAKDLPLPPEIVHGPHPNSRVKGVSTSDALDSLW